MKFTMLQEITRKLLQHQLNFPENINLIYESALFRVATFYSPKATENFNGNFVFSSTEKLSNLNKSF